ncbi:MAG: DNA recombination protein RmuC [Propionibacteriaceae bacterium]|jgi:DNA recombination protein RmuC|nr:DNA recombination protein RmuC [Propionibacteriaceae bacterium]
MIRHILTARNDLPAEVGKARHVAESGLRPAAAKKSLAFALRFRAAGRTRIRWPGFRLGQGGAKIVVPGGQNVAMEFLGWILAVAVTVVAAIALVLLTARARGGVAELPVVRARLEEVTRQRDKLSQDVRDGQALLDRSRSELAQAQAELASARAEQGSALKQLAEVKENRQELIAEIERGREQLAIHFKAISADALKEQKVQADSEAAERLRKTEAVMTPVRENLTKLERKLSEVEIERAKMSAELKEQVSTVKSTGEDLRRETAALATALRKPQTRGAWGELQLRRVVEAAGMKEHVDFAEQHSAHNAEGKPIRPDLVVQLGDGRAVFVDSKVPMQAFLDALEIEDADQRASELARVAKHLQTHIDQLSAKEYFTADSGTPEFVVLFIPHEAMAAEALNQNPGLHEYAFSKNIVLATPSSLVAMLKTVAYSWKQNVLAENARQIAELGQELYKRLNTLGGHFLKLGASLGGAVDAYNAAVGSLERNVLSQARKMHDFGIASAELKQLPKVSVEVRRLQKMKLIEGVSPGQLPATVENGADGTHQG